MTVEIALVFLIVVGALVLFASEKLPLDVTALLVLATVMVVPLVGHSPFLLERGIDLEAAFPTVSEGLSGLSSRATVTVLAMFILSAGVQRSGLIHVLGKRLFPLVGESELRQLLIIALLVGPISGFINNTAAVAVTMPLVIEMARRGGFSAARLLLPLSFFGMLGGTLTLVGTSTNILASSILAEEHAFGREIGMFEFTRLGLIVLGVGLVYFVTVGRWLLPRGDGRGGAGDPPETFVVELRVSGESPLLGKSLADAGFAGRHAVEVVKLVRDGQTHLKRAESLGVQPGDVIVVRATVRQVMDLIKTDEVRVISEFGTARRVRGDGRMARVLLRDALLFKGRTGADVDLWSRYRARPIGLEVDRVESRRLGDEPLHVGEIVLMEVSRSALARLRRNPGVVVLEELADDFDRRRMRLAGSIVAGVVAMAALTPLPIVVTALLGVIAMALTGCIDRDDIYSGVAWEVIFLLAGLIPLGVAMTKSGAADWLAGLLAAQASSWHPLLVLMALYALTTMLTELVSNNASVVVLVPVAISIAGILDVNLFPLVLTVVFAASTSFLTPVGYQTNSMIYGTGLYRFSDFARVGALLNVILMVVTSLSIWWLWPMS